MRCYAIEGGTPLKGELQVKGNKNAVLPMIAAALLTDEPVLLRNVPDIVDVDVMLRAARSLGVETRREADAVTLTAANVKSVELDRELCSSVRTSLLFTGPLLARTGKATIWPPGGDVIGRRRLDAHFYGLKGLGAKLLSETHPYVFEMPEAVGRDLFFDEASVTATEHILMTATLAKGRTILRNAAAEPHVVDLGNLLLKMGAQISGLGTNTITIDGVEKLSGADHQVVSDHIEAASFLAMVAATHGEATIHGTTPGQFWMARRVFERLGVEFELHSDHIFLPGGQSLAVKPDFGNAIPVVADGPWPQFPSDMMSCSIVLATQCAGAVLFFEKMFESRLYFVDRLVGMGANAIVCDPHRVLISGPSQLRGTELSSPDIRSGMALVIAALCAKGKSLIHNANIIDRGYTDIVSRIEALGGRISERNG